MNILTAVHLLCLGAVNYAPRNDVELRANGWKLKKTPSGFIPNPERRW